METNTGEISVGVFIMEKTEPCFWVFIASCFVIFLKHDLLFFVVYHFLFALKNFLKISPEVRQLPVRTVVKLSVQNRGVLPC